MPKPADPLAHRAASPAVRLPDRSARLLVITLVLITSTAAVISSLGAPLVSDIARAYGVRLAEAQWILTAGLLSGAVTTPFLGRLGNGPRRRPTILVTMGLVTAGTLVSAFAATLAPSGFFLMVLGRALQGTGLGLVAVALAVARDTISERRRPFVISVLSVATVAGAGLGYPITGLIADWGGLTTAYLFGALLAGGTLALAAWVIPATVDSPNQPLDVPGALWLSIAMVSVLLAITQGGAWGWASARVLSLGVFGCVALLGWVAFTLRRRHPLVDLRLAVRPGLIAPNVVTLTGGVGMYFMLSLVVVLVQVRQDSGWGLGMSIAAAGLVLTPYSLGAVLGSRVAFAVDRRNPAWLLPIGCGLFMAGTLFLALFDAHLWQALVGMGLGGLGSGFTFSSLPLLMLPHVPAAETASAMALNQVLRYLGFSTGSTVSVVLMGLLGPGAVSATGYQRALLVMAAAWVAIGAMSVLLQRRTPRVATSA